MPKLEVVNANNVIEFNPQKANFKLKNTGGPKGEPGAQGPQGPKGDTGAQGPAGASASVTVGSTTTLSPGADATVTNSGDTRNAILNFGIPTGARGPKGDTGSKGDTGPIGPKGAKGDTGAAATVQVGNTNTGAPGTNAQVTNAGNEHFAVFNFTIPRGDKGEKGATGAQGAKGDKGDKGDTGTAATITVGSTTTTNPGTNATVTNTGTSSAAVLNFGIPRGATGSVKSEVVSELPETGEGDTFYLVNREATTQTATGKAISFENSDNAGDITDFQLDGETSQNGTPTPSAPVAVQTVTGENVVKICGKNLANIPDFNITQGGSYNVSSLNKTISVSSTTSNVAISLSSGINGGSWLPAYNASSVADHHITSVGGTYILSLANVTKTISGSQALYVAIYTNKRAVSNTSLTSSTNFTPSAITLDSDEYIKDIWIWLGGNTTYTATFNVQLERGSTATEYQPYQGQSYEVNLGKNLFDKEADTGAFRASKSISGEDIAITATASNSGYVAFVIPDSDKLKGKACTISIGNSVTSASGAKGAFAIYQSTKASPASVGTFVTNGEPDGNNYSKSFTFSSSYSGSNDCFVLLLYPSNAGSGITTGDNTAYSNVQIELGSQATSYAPYFTPIELCKIGTYQDYIYKSGGKWYVHKEIGKVDLSTCTWYDVIPPGILRGTTSIQNVKYVSSNQQVGSAVAEKYIIHKGSGMSSASLAGYFAIDVSAVAVNTGDASINPTGNMYYALATPTDTEITNQALVAQLDNVASAPLYTGVNNITTITPNEQGTLEIKYVTYDKYNQNKVYIWNDTLQQWQIIVP